MNAVRAIGFVCGSNICGVGGGGGGERVNTISGRRRRRPRRPSSATDVVWRKTRAIDLMASADGRSRKERPFSQPPPSFPLSCPFSVLSNLQIAGQGQRADRSIRHHFPAAGTGKGVRSVDCVQEQKREEGRIKVIDCADSGKVSGYTSKTLSPLDISAC